MLDVKSIGDGDSVVDAHSTLSQDRLHSDASIIESFILGQDLPPIDVYSAEQQNQLTHSRQMTFMMHRFTWRMYSLLIER
jgi:hypothetical protein